MRSATSSRPPPGLVAALIYGPDQGLVRERADKLARTVVPDLSDPFRVADLDESALGADPARLADEAAALSMLGGRRVVRVRSVGKRPGEALREFSRTSRRRSPDRGGGRRSRQECSAARRLRRGRQCRGHSLLCRQRPRHCRGRARNLEGRRAFHCRRRAGRGGCRTGLRSWRDPARDREAGALCPWPGPGDDRRRARCGRRRIRSAHGRSLRRGGRGRHGQARPRAGAAVGHRHVADRRGAHQPCPISSVWRS